MSMHDTPRLRIALALALLGAALAACGPRLHHGHGTVVAVDASRGQVTLDHERMPGFMDAMTMTYTVAQPSLLEGIRVGEEVDFALEQRGDELRIRSIEPRR
jgi:Cu/Ag efflux protein CusF